MRRCRRLDWFLLLPVYETVGCSCPLRQRSSESRCAILSKVMSNWLMHFPSASTQHPFPPTHHTHTDCSPIFAYGWGYLPDMAVIRNKAIDLHWLCFLAVFQSNWNTFDNRTQWDCVFVWAGGSFHNFPVQQSTKDANSFESEKLQFWKSVIVSVIGS